MERLSDQWHELREQISITPANSVKGVLFKVRELAKSATEGKFVWGDELAQTTVADLERLVARGSGPHAVT